MKLVPSVGENTILSDIIKRLLKSCYLQETVVRGDVGQLFKRVARYFVGVRTRITSAIMKWRFLGIP